MGFGNLAWNNLHIGIVGGVNNPTQFKSEAETESMQKLPSGERITEEGYLTNAPETIEEGKDFIHQIIHHGNNVNMFKIGINSKWKEICPDMTTNYWNVSRNYTAKKVRDDELISHLTEQMRDCNGSNKLAGNHYWVDKTEKVSSGCGDESAINYSMDGDYIDDSLCEYECLDPHNIPDINGSCSGVCNDGYEMVNGVCEVSAKEKITNNLVENVGTYGLIIVSAIGLKLFFGR